MQATQNPARQKQYIAIDLKSFYASVECVERGLDPLNTHLVVADESRTDKTICLAVSPSLKAYGIPGRARLFEVKQKLELVNAYRLAAAPSGRFTGESSFADVLQANPNLKLKLLVACPQMKRYMAYSAQIYQIYLKYIAPEDIHVYSIDEVFIDATPYLRSYGCSARELAARM
ncbi:MAG: DNA methylase, partial [Oscillospiraceae bacterium]|nr:DNA methylase [Oscillospiraceae bacterium]